MEYQYKTENLFISMKSGSIEYNSKYKEVDDLLLEIADLMIYVRTKYNDINNKWLYKMLRELYIYIDENDNNDILYFIIDYDRVKVKIGRTKNIESRLRKLKSTTPFNIDLLKIIENGGKYESRLHKEFDDNNLTFSNKFDGFTEWFYIDDRLNRFISNIDLKKLEKKYGK